MSGTRVKKQHHVPQMYLRAWANSNDRLFVLLKDQKKVVSSRVGDVSCESAFYDVPVRPDLEPQFVENQLAKVESMLAPFVEEISQLTIESKPYPFNRRRRDAISLLISLQMVRSLESRKKFEEGLQFLVNRGRAISKVPLPDSVTLKITSEAIKLDHVEFMSRYLIEFGDMIREKTLLVGFRAGGDCFWTSDNPVLVMDTGHGNGLESLGAIIVLPVSPEAIVLATDALGVKHLNSLSSRGPVLFSTKETDQLNNMQVRSAVRQVISNQNKFKKVLKRIDRGYYAKPSRIETIESSEFYVEWQAEFSKACEEEPFEEWCSKRASGSDDNFSDDSKID